MKAVARFIRTVFALCMVANSPAGWADDNRAQQQTESKTVVIIFNPPEGKEREFLDYFVPEQKAYMLNHAKNQKKSCARNNAMGLVAMEHAYVHCSDWLDKLVVQLRRNQRQVHNALLNTLLEYHPSQATYLAWIDARQAETDVFNRILHKGIAVSDGHEFGAPGWIRFNFACPEVPLKKATDTLCELFGIST